MIYEHILLLPLLLQLMILSYTISIDSYISRKHRRVLWIIIILVFGLLLQDEANFLLSHGTPRPFLRTIVSIVGYSLRPVVLLLFSYIVRSGKRHWAGWVLIAVNAAVHMTALFSDICFFFTESGYFLRGPLGYTCHIVSGILLVKLVWESVQEHKKNGWRELFIPLIIAAFIVISIPMDHYLYTDTVPFSYLTIVIVSSTLFYYIWLHLQFVREHERAFQAEQRIQIMTTQIQPHFLFNTIATIKALCRRDPEKAANVADKFGAYLRQNLDSLESPGLIPFRKELAHTKIYADIEMVRFENVRVEYDIEDDDFAVPPLTVQPMAENAIRHGVRIREEGIVRISTRRAEDSHVITIWDNGIGFDPDDLKETDSGHIGIRNVRERVESLCGGTLELKSRAGEGTTVVIRIPVKEAAE